MRTKQFLVMSVVILSICVFPLPAEGGESAVPMTKYDYDTPHSAVEFTIGFMGLTNVRGRFADYAGTVMFDSEDITKTTTTVIIKTESIDTDNDWRDKHLKSSDFFDVEKYPHITFQSQSVTRSADGYVMHGTLIMHGVSKEIDVPFKVLHEEAKDGWGNRRIGLVAELKLNRKEYGVVGGTFWNKQIDLNRMALTDDVTISLSVQGRIANMNKMNFRKGEKPPIGELFLSKINEEGIESGLKFYSEAKSQHAEEYSFSEWDIQLTGSRLLGAEKVDEAIAVFELAAKEYPESADSFDSLAEAYAAQGNGDMALINYRKVLEIDPHSTSAIEMTRWLTGKTDQLTLATE